VSLPLALVIGFGALAIGLAGGRLTTRAREPRQERPRSVRRTLVPFTGQTISQRAFEAAARLAKAENSTIVPAFLARVPRTLPIESPLLRQCAAGMPLLEAIEQQATALGIPVDARVARGRTYRDALNRLLGTERFDRIIVSATSNGTAGLSNDDLRWLLERVPAEVLILRPAPDDTRRISAENLRGHF
jgi:nucleotide-binding universal stress UspA family protein